MSVQSIEPKEAYEDLKSGGKALLLDVRTPAEFDEIHAVGALLQPLDKFDAEQVLATFSKRNHTCIYLLCQSGQRATMAAKKLSAVGHSQAKVVSGGTRAWAAHGLPVRRGKSVMSLERQVRIAAGSLVTAGVALGWSVHPAFFGLSAFVGAGLVFAGLTDTCAMGMVLSKLPWNQRGAASASAGLNHG